MLRVTLDRYVAKPLGPRKGRYTLRLITEQIGKYCASGLNVTPGGSSCEKCAKQNSLNWRLRLSWLPKKGTIMALERDHNSERLARIDFLLAQAKRTVAQAQLPPIDPKARDNISNHLDELNSLRGPLVGSSGTRLSTRRLFTNADRKQRRA